MAKCEYCKKEMLKAKSCIYPYVEIDGKIFERNTTYYDDNNRCHDCGIINGNIHHFGCDMERCPKCDGQLFICSCEKSLKLKK